MNIPTEKHIETYILNRSSLTVKEQEWIQDWIQKDEEVLLLTEWFRISYKKMEQIESVKERSNHLPSVITLKPDYHKSKYSRNVFVLAAQTPVTDRGKKALKTIRTFVSEEHKTLIRILHNSSKNHSKLHVISAFLQDDDIVLIDVGDPKNTTLVSEPGGTFVIFEEEFPESAIKNWQKCELHQPISKIRVYKDEDQDTLNFDTTETHFERKELSLEKSGDKLMISFDCSVEKIPDKMVIYTGEKSSIWPVENGEFSITIQNLSSPVSSLFFYK